jgi:hypothetical protein
LKDKNESGVYGDLGRQWNVPRTRRPQWEICVSSDKKLEGTWSKKDETQGTLKQNVKRFSFKQWRWKRGHEREPRNQCGYKGQWRGARQETEGCFMILDGGYSR